MLSRSRLTHSIVVSCLFALLLWWVKLFEFFTGYDLGFLGTYPQSVSGTVGIVFAPFVHGSFTHLINNTLPLVIMGTLLLYGYPKTYKRVLLWVWLLSGVGVWLFAREASHIGASGLTHGVFFFLFIASILRRDKQSVAMMMIVFFLYGSMSLTILPTEPGISFEYHLFGGLTGAVLALFYYKHDPIPEPEKYQWEKEPDEDDPLIGDLWQQSPDQSSDQSK